MNDPPPRSHVTVPASPRPADPSTGLYLRSVRRYWWLPLVTGLAAATVALLASLSQPTTYTATAELVLRPFPQYDETFVGVDAIRQVGDVTQTTETVAAQLEGTDTATAASKLLRPPPSADSVARAVTVAPVGQSNVLAVQAESEDPALSVALADAYARAAVETRRARFLRTLRDRVKFLEARKQRLPEDDYGGQNDLGSKLNTLTAVQNQGVDPTIERGSPGGPAEEQATLRPARTVPLAALVGMLLGSLAAVGVTLRSRFLTSPDEAAAMAGLPVLARLPRQQAQSGGPGAIAPSKSTPEAWEAYRALAAQVIGGGGGGRVFAVVSASRGDGRTSTAAGLGMALAELGAQVLLLDADARNPGLALAVRARPGSASSADAVQRLGGRLLVAADEPRMSVLIPSRRDGASAGSPQRQFADVLADAPTAADFVIVDTPPFAEVSDALSVALDADGVVLVARPGRTDRDVFGDLLSGLRQSGARLTGLVLVGHRGRRRRGASAAARPDFVVRAPSASDRESLSSVR